MCETRGLVEIFGDVARSNLAPNFSNQHERLLFCARKDGRITARHDLSTKQNFHVFLDRERTSLGQALKRSVSRRRLIISAMAILCEDIPRFKSGQT